MWSQDAAFTITDHVGRCAERGENARVSDFQFEVEEMVAEALAQVFIETFVGVDECAVNLRIVTDIGPTSAP